MLKSIEKLLRIVAIEANSGYANRTIIGGMEKYLPAWLEEAFKDAVPGELLTQIERFFHNYAGLDVAQRAAASRDLNRLLRGISNEEYGQGTEVAASVVEVPQQDAVEPVRQKHNQTAPQTAAPTSQPNIGLSAPLTILQGIGSVKSDLFKNLGVSRIEDLLYYFPRRYVDYSKLKTINRIEFGDELTVIATVQSLMTTSIPRKNQARVEVIVTDGTGFLRLVFFRSLKYIASFENHFRRGTQLAISGKVTMYLGRKQMNDPAFEQLDQTHLNTNRITPVYPLTAGLTQKDIRTAVNSAIQFYITRVQDYLPQQIRNETGLVDLGVALHQVHYPDTMELLGSARDRLAFDEIFLLQLGVQQQKSNWQANPAIKYAVSDDILTNILEHLPFALTNAQQNVIIDIRQDLDAGKPMNRLVQGDVGSGKTIIAAIASVIVNLNQGQTAFMAPTGILAEQHYETLNRVLVSEDDSLPLHPGEIRLLTGDTPAGVREEISAGLQDGTVKILIGTHALIEDPVKFKNLQLAVVDEQHRFGIAQRAALRQKGENPHLLVLSATPIPRSLALTLFGDLDISIIDEMPIGRQPVETRIIHPFDRDGAYQMINEEIKKGHQAFIIYPLIDKGEDEEQKAAVDDHGYLQKEIFSHLNLGLLHGRLAAEEKERVMNDFRNRKYDILVSTTVIEVGVDIPNATVMLIEGANRFGLAQLHQLRGRVGRGDDQAYCLLVPENEDALENERLAVMTETTNGFVLAEKDLEQRGPGDFIGYRQSGFADLRMASLTDIHLIEKARHYAQELIKTDPMLEKPENQLINRKLSSMWSYSQSDIS